MNEKFLDRKKRTPAYEAAVVAIRALQTEGGFADRAYSEAVAEQQRDQWAARHGLKRSEGRLCFNRLLGKYCRVGRDRDGCQMCSCPVSDHDTLWNGPDGKPAVILCQPYPFSWEELLKLVRWCEEHGFEASIGTWPSFHFPTAVLSVEITPKGRGLWTLAKAAPK